MLCLRNKKLIFSVRTLKLVGKLHFNFKQNVQACTSMLQYKIGLAVFGLNGYFGICQIEVSNCLV